MNDELYKFLAEIIVAKIKNDENITNEVLRELDFSPLIDFMREEVLKLTNGVELIISLLLSGNEAKIVLGLNLSKAFLKLGNSKNDLYKILNELMNKTNSFWIKINVILRFLDAEEYNKNHLDYLKYILDHIVEFDRYVPIWCSGHEFIESFVENRLKDSNFPKSKSWFYILMLKNIKSKDYILGMLKKYDNKIEIINTIENNI